MATIIMRGADLGLNDAGTGLFGGTVARLLTGWRERQRVVRTRNELLTLSDRELADIGIVRSEIDAIARSCR